MGGGAPGAPTAMVSIRPGPGWAGGKPGAGVTLGGAATGSPPPMGPATGLAREGGPLGMEVICLDGPAGGGVSPGMGAPGIPGV